MDKGAARPPESAFGEEIASLITAQTLLRQDVESLKRLDTLKWAATGGDSIEDEEQALMHAREMGALRNRAEEAQKRADVLMSQIERLRQVRPPAEETRWIAELEHLQSEMEEMRALHNILAGELRTLRMELTAALAGLPRPGPVQGPPPGSHTGLVQDYMVLARSSLMDPAWYKAHYTDVAAAGADPIMHYLQEGWREGRRPGPVFDGVAYVRANPDLAETCGNPLLHYLSGGAVELRPPAQFPPVAAEPQTAVRSLRAPIKIVADLHSVEEFLEFRRNHPEAFSEATEASICTSAMLYGTRSEFFGELGPEHTEIRAGDTRESLISGGLSSRTRAVVDLLIEELRRDGKDPAKAKIYGHEAVTHLAALARNRFPGFLGTEFAPTEEARRSLLPFIHNDICASQFPNESFDATFSCDVFEHVYDRDAALRETARTTKHGGVFLATFPFFFEDEVGSIFAEIINGKLIHHLETPIYHGNPVDEDRGSLVFEIPGWDIVERACRAGFSRAAMRLICDEVKGVTASGEGRPDGPRGVFVLVARR
jgi:SAM-dependent methyltransferase